MYKYQFKKEECWYKNTCNLYNTSECRSSCNRYMEMDYLIKNSNIPPNKQKIELLVPESEDLNTFIALDKIKKDIFNFVSSGNNIYLYSELCGNGKTSWAIKLMLKYFDDIWNGNGFKTRGIFIHVPTFLTMIKENISISNKSFEKMRSKLADVDLVIWDDIASTKLSDFDYLNLLTYIDMRKLNGKANIYTGNLGENEIKLALGNRLCSRVWNDSYKAKINGIDRRGADCGSITNYK